MTAKPFWLLLLYALPARPSSERVNIWRKLKKFGAMPLKSSGHVLPDEPAHLERFQWLAKEIQDAGGDATLARIAEIDGLSTERVVDMFNETRAKDYTELAADLKKVLASYRKGKEEELTTELRKCQRRFREIREIDYFNSPGAHDAQMELHRAEKTLSSGPRAKSQPRLSASDFVGKTWLTRPRPGIDRAGSAWLIRKAVDPNASFVFGMDQQKHPGAVPFDMADADLSHHGEDCTFETLVKRFGIMDRAILKMAEMVHDADLEDEKFQRRECIGINAVLTGWARTSMTDTELLDKGIECFEGLYKAVKK